jgi:hypothetical protein
MRATVAHRVEAAMGYAAAGSFAAAVGFATFHATGRFTALPGMLAAACVSGLLAYPMAVVLLRRLEGQAKPFPQLFFEMVEIESVSTPDADELLLTDACRLETANNDEALMLEDVLAEVAPEARIVQLFDPAAMPTSRQLQDRIDRHLVGGTPAPDASEALFAALADLRRSLR